MKKKILTLILTLSLVAVVFTGCNKSKSPVESDKPSTDVTNEVKGNFIDGKYLIKREVTDHGNFTMATLEVEDGQVSNLNYNEYLVDSGEAKNDSNYDYADGIAVIKDLNEQFNEKKDIEKIDFDALTGATTTKGDFKEITSRLLKMAEKGETYEAVYVDGVYEVQAEEDSHGWLPQVTVKIQDGQIVGIDYAEFAIDESDGVKKGDRKSEDNYEYTIPFEMTKSIQKSIIDNNGTENLELDGITGATTTKTTMIELVDQALSKAK